MDIKLVDVTLHIDENLDAEQRGTIEESLRALDGVVSVHNPDKTPHLTVVEYNPDESSSGTILNRIKDQGAHAELVGL
ncbi:MAG: ATP-binding protein [Pseudomonadota bacterium]|nr:ATP-binding protein [Pseudomonadota bacterium]